MKRFLTFVLIMVCVLNASISIFAATESYSSSYFNDAWESSDSGETWEIIYGYNEFAINEDYTHSNAVTSHTSKVQHSGHSHSASAAAWKWANVDTVHSGSPVTYSITY